MLPLCIVANQAVNLRVKVVWTADIPPVLDVNVALEMNRYVKQVYTNPSSKNIPLIKPGYKLAIISKILL
jgi:hypothetical protein